MEILSVFDKAFSQYGRVIATADKSAETKEILDALETLEIPDETIYVASEPVLENVAARKWVSEQLFGEMPIQMGYCNGFNRAMNAMEYHKCSEVNLAGTDMILMLGKQQDIEDGFKYDTSKAQLFFVPKGTLIECYATTLHYAPCHTEKGGFRSLVVLTKGTNTDVECEHSEDESKLITAKNKWLIAHADSDLPKTSHFGLYGENITLSEV